MSSRATGGSTLLEVAASVAMLSALVLVLFNLMPTSLRAVSVGRENLEADSLAQSILDDYRSRPFQSLQPTPPTALPAANGAPGVSYRPTLQIRPVQGASPSRFLELHVSVEWTARQSNYRREYGVYVSKVRY